MRVSCKVFSLPKAGNTDEEYEDAACPETSHDSISVSEYRCAIADGATETSFAKNWAMLLVNGYVDQLPLEELREEWQHEIPTDNQPWYVEEKAQAGAYAALVGLSLSVDGTYSCESVGDSCVLQVRDNRLTFSFPLESASQFNNQPLLLSSKTDDADNSRLFSNGLWESGDTFILVSDAIACWIMSEPDHLKKILEVETSEEFKELIEFERNPEDKPDAVLHNDDVTFMRIEITT